MNFFQACKFGILFQLIGLLLLTSCGTSPVAIREGAKFNRDLVNAIDAADKIEIVQHSFWTDFHGAVAARKIPENVYQKRDLPFYRVNSFKKMVKRMSGVTKKEFSTCVFEPHHTMHFYLEGKKTSSLKICFKCEDIQWSGSEHTQSRDLFKVLDTVMWTNGFDRHLDWKKQAKKGPRHMKNPHTGDLIDIEGIPSGTMVRDPSDSQGRTFRVP